MKLKVVLPVDGKVGTIVMDRGFAKAAENVYSEEYERLQAVRKDYPNYQVIVSSPIKKNANKKTYKGLNYDYMRTYIITREKENKEAVLNELDELILMSKCQGYGLRYPVIKRWFLAKYPEIAEYGMDYLKEKVAEKEAQEKNNIFSVKVAA